MDQPTAGVVVDDLVALQSRYQGALLQVAAGYVRSRAVAEEVVQDTWAGAVAGLHRFEERSSLKTWVFRILENIARTTARRESRTVPFSSMPGTDAAGRQAAPEDLYRWVRACDGGADTPESRLLFAELSRMLTGAIEVLPPRERDVLILRAVHGRSSQEVCELLRISDANQRVTLHRARSRLRACLGSYLGPGLPEKRASPEKREKPAMPEKPVQREREGGR